MRSYALVVVLYLVIPAHTTNIQWKRYKNERWGFCAEAPKDWRMDEGVNGAGGRFDLPGGRGVSSVSVGALPNQCVDTHEPYGQRCDRRETLQEIDAADIKQLKENGVRNLRVLSLRKETYQGMDALFTRRSYHEKGAPVTEQILRFLANDNTYAIEFQCRLQDVERCDSAFRHLAATFRLTCE